MWVRVLVDHAALVLSRLDAVESTLFKAPAFSTGHGMASAEVACCAAAGALLRVCRAGEVALVVAGIDDGRTLRGALRLGRRPSAR